MEVIRRLIIDGESYDYIGVNGDKEYSCAICELKDLCDELNAKERLNPCSYIGMGGSNGCFIKSKDTEAQPATATEHDAVNHPHYYTSHPSGVECIQITRHYCFAIGNAIKYLWRAGLKQDVGTPPKEKEIQDLEKAAWYINDRIKQLKNS